jgi:hypothetical protein
MSTISLRLPESLHAAARELAKKEKISINQLITTAVAEKLAALTTEEYLEARAKRGRRKNFLRALGKAPNVDPDEIDRL